MALVDNVKTVLGRLAGRGWGDLLRRHGLDLGAADLVAELARTLPGIDRRIEGFEDYSADGNRGIEPANPGLSLVYHALASPAVHPKPAGSRKPEDYPTTAELDTIENYIYSVARRRLSDFSNPVIGVFAYQYRVGAKSPHGIHADMAYCRTGVSRIGTAAANYDPMRRSFWVLPANNSNRIAVMPARYGAFLALKRGQTDADAILNGRSMDRVHTFLFPVHKLFPGQECLVGEDIRDFAFAEAHVSEKLRKVHTAGGVPVIAGFDINAAPYVRTSAALITMQSVGATVLIVPNPSDTVVRSIKQRNSVSGRNEVVRFRVPPANNTNRFFTSMQIPAGNRGRLAPEYVHIRRRINAEGTIDDLNQLNDADFQNTLRAGNYEAVHFADDSCDGSVAIKFAPLSRSLQQYAAYSLVTAPDFLPLVDQLDIQLWSDHNSSQFAQGGPEPLCDGRNAPPNPATPGALPGRVPNPALPSATQPNTAAFDRSDPVNLTVTAVVGVEAKTAPSAAAARRTASTSFLTDAASDVFAPGWDISQGADDRGSFYHNYGLGSPFPEDAKLCAALNSFWPAAAPDAGRTFPETGGFTALPLMDDEIGYHPQHPRVLRGEVASKRGWDGEFGPFFAANGAEVNFASIDRSDYTSHALDNLISPAPLASIDSTEQIARMDALRFSIQIVPPNNDAVNTTRLLLVTAEKVPDWAARSDRATSQLQGEGYLYVFARLKGAVQATGDPARHRRAAQTTITCQISANVLCFKVNSGAFQTVARPPQVTGNPLPQAAVAGSSG